MIMDKTIIEHDTESRIQFSTEFCVEKPSKKGNLNFQKGREIYGYVKIYGHFQGRV